MTKLELNIEDVDKPFKAQEIPDAKKTVSFEEAFKILLGFYRELQTENRELKILLRSTLEYIETLSDEGPEDEGWQSQKLMALIQKIKEV